MRMIKFFFLMALNSANLFHIFCSSVHYQQDIMELLNMLHFPNYFSTQ